VISGAELALWLSATSADQLVERSDAFADLIGDGLLAVETNGDAIVSLSASAEGRARLLILPATVS
jgi:hypothetical protein